MSQSSNQPPEEPDDSKKKPKDCPRGKTVLPRYTRFLGHTRFPFMVSRGNMLLGFSKKSGRDELFKIFERL